MITQKTTKQIIDEYNLHMHGECFLSPKDRVVCNELESVVWVCLDELKKEIDKMKDKFEDLTLTEQGIGYLECLFDIENLCNLQEQNKRQKQ